MTSELCVTCCALLGAIQVKQCDSANSVQRTNKSIAETWLLNKKFTGYKSVYQIKPRLLVQRAVKITKDIQDSSGGDIGDMLEGASRKRDCHRAFSRNLKISTDEAFTISCGNSF